MKQIVNVYIDGFNFYYGLKSKFWKRYYWLDIVKFYEYFLKENQQLGTVYYFTAKPFDEGQKARQAKFLSANECNTKFQVIYGKFLQKEIRLKNGGIENTFEEKQTDLNIAVELIRNILKSSCDISILVSGDSDLVPAISLCKEINTSHKILAHFPPKRQSKHLSNICDAVFHLERYENRFAKCQLDENVTLPNGHIISKPTNWI